ncbi:MAG: GIY-YIG nuclease family protein [Patescibacteria group bacterium]
MFWFKRKAEQPIEEEVVAAHWYTYMVRCADGSLYTDVAADVSQAMREINAGQGPKYTRMRYPVFLVHSEEFMNDGDAERRADMIRKLDRRRKENLLSDLMVGALEA